MRQGIAGLGIKGRLSLGNQRNRGTLALPLPSSYWAQMGLPRKDRALFQPGDPLKPEPFQSYKGGGEPAALTISYQMCVDLEVSFYDDNPMSPPMFPPSCHAQFWPDSCNAIQRPGFHTSLRQPPTEGNSFDTVSKFPTPIPALKSPKTSIFKMLIRSCRRLNLVQRGETEAVVDWDVEPE